ncbi:MAG: hypothetical protein PHN44_01315 [Candidatus Marinimicrobia bacterium]|nr:hypothetical protein [Candidatus Neomarinimicrobiota bacterium]
MNRDEFVKQAVASGKPKDEIKRVYDSIDAAGEFDDQQQVTPEPASSVAPVENKPTYEQRVQSDADVAALNSLESTKKDPGMINQVAAPVKAFTGTMAAQLNESLPYRLVGKVVEPAARWASKNMEGTSQSIGAAVNAYKKHVPEPAKNILGIIGDLSQMVPGVAVAEKAVMVAPKVGGAADRTIGNAIKTATRDPYEKALELGVNKGIKPSVVGKTTLAQKEKFTKNVDKSVNTILEKKNDISIIDKNGIEVNKAPSNLKEFEQAIPQTKRIIYDQYHSMATAAGKGGVAFNEAPVVDHLKSIAEDVSRTPEIRRAAEKLIPEIEELRGMSPEQIEKRISDYNQDLKSYYAKSPGIDGVTAGVKKGAADLIREELDKNITEAMGSGYQELKNKYGSLAAIERDVNHRALMDARKNTKGLTDLSDMYMAMEAISGIAGNPYGLLKAGAGLAVKERIKFLNNPNTYINKMFKEAEKKQSKGAGVQKQTIGEAISPAIKGPSSIGSELAIPAYKRKGVDVEKNIKSETDARIAEQANKYRITPEKYQQIESDILSEEQTAASAKEASEKAKEAAIESDIYLENLEKKPVITIDELRKKSRVEKMNEGKRIKKSGNKPGDIPAWHKLGDNPTIGESISVKGGKKSTIGDILGNEKGSVGGMSDNLVGTPAIRDPETGKIYEGGWRGHKDAITKGETSEIQERLKHQHFLDNSDKPTENVGFIDRKGNFISRSEAEKVAKLPKSPLQMFHDEGGAVGGNPQIHTENFKNWFGDWKKEPAKASKVVDEKGEPLVVYHGTNKEFTEFDNDFSAQGVHWFSSDKSKIEAGKSGAASSKKIIPAYLNAKKLAGWKEYEKYSLGEIKDLGYDGIKLDDDYVIFKPNQVKSAAGNSGKFSKTIDDIRGSSALKTLAATGAAAGGALTIGEALKSKKKKGK